MAGKASMIVAAVAAAATGFAIQAAGVMLTLGIVHNDVSGAVGAPSFLISAGLLAAYKLAKSTTIKIEAS